jgi:hypothetical protein
MSQYQVRSVVGEWKNDLPPPHIGQEIEIIQLGPAKVLDVIRVGTDIVVSVEMKDHSLEDALDLVDGKRVISGDLIDYTKMDPSLVRRLQIMHTPAGSLEPMGTKVPDGCPGGYGNWDSSNAACVPHCPMMKECFCKKTGVDPKLVLEPPTKIRKSAARKDPDVTQEVKPQMDPVAEANIAQAKVKLDEAIAVSSNAWKLGKEAKTSDAFKAAADAHMDAASAFRSVSSMPGTPAKTQKQTTRWADEHQKTSEKFLKSASK